MLNNYCFRFLRVSHFTPEIAWIIRTNKMEISTFLSDFDPDSITWRNFEVVMEVKSVCIGRLENGLWEIHSMGFKYTLVIAIEFLGIIGVVLFLHRNFN